MNSRYYAPVHVDGYGGGQLEDIGDIRGRSTTRNMMAGSVSTLLLACPW